MANIRYIQRSEIDITKWDQCIDNAPNGLIYANSFYLDAMCDNWDALVMGDYEAVMPLPWRRKWGFYYLFQPFLTPHLGIFGNLIDENLVKSFLSAIPFKFRFWEINLNTSNDFLIHGLSLIKKPNYLLNLNGSYDDIKTGYRKNHIRSTNKAIKLGCIYQEDIPLHNVIALAELQLQQYTRLKNSDLARFTDLCYKLKQQNKALAVGVFMANQLVSGAIFFFHRQFAYYILAGNNSKAREIGASPFLLDSFIKKRANSDFTLDFVGSSIHSIASFYEGFGAIKRDYIFVRLNRLPKIIKWLKD